jgi:hypothetical protein
MLPRLLPMLAVPAAPFASPEYSFEVKWDGIRALAILRRSASPARTGAQTSVLTEERL